MTNYMKEIRELLVSYIKDRSKTGLIIEKKKLQQLADIISSMCRRIAQLEKILKRNNIEMNMQMEIECEFDQFQEDFEKGIVHQQYLNEFTYRDDYSGDDIRAAQEELRSLIFLYLHSHAPGKYGMCIDWSVRVFDPVEYGASEDLAKYIVY